MWSEKFQRLSHGEFYVRFGPFTLQKIKGWRLKLVRPKDNTVQAVDSTYAPSAKCRKCGKNWTLTQIFNCLICRIIGKVTLARSWRYKLLSMDTSKSIVCQLKFGLVSFQLNTTGKDCKLSLPLHLLQGLSLSQVSCRKNFKRCHHS